ncbi:piggyBac transposable element-derived protein 3 [Etheostoma spectabile]|uniref:piggyBac transposable element-derived protein 3 n=1 Tax=Etheostoma spectabile TaxID=54343 RepID=UPI0013AE9C1E|nr:piggyBac transposable element-derived protein 3-like [Etheostoma spectabile]
MGWSYTPNTLTADQVDDLFSTHLTSEGSNKRAAEETVLFSGGTISKMQKVSRQQDPDAFKDNRKTQTYRQVDNNQVQREGYLINGLSDDNESVDEEDNEVDDDASEEDVPRLPRWRTPHSANITDYTEWQASLPKSDNIMSPYEYFKMFFSEDLLEVVVEQSNLYAIQCTHMFWNKATRVSQVADTMALNRWEFIKKSLHFNNNNQVRQGENVDLLHKIRPLVTHLTLKLQKIPMGEKLAVDEQMVPFKGRNRLKQYLPSKPKRWGYKILILAGSDGVPHNFEIYTGRVVQHPELPDVGASGNVVLRLAEPIPTQQNYKLFFDNWFTSVPLILTLAHQGIHCTGTIRGNRLPGVNLMCDAELKRTGRGSFEQKTAMVGETTLHAVKWYDNRSVSLLSDYIGAHPVTEVDRRDCSSTGMRREEQMKLYTFKSYIAESLCKSGKNLDRKRGRPSSTIAGEYDEKRRRGPTTPIPVPDVRLDATAHWMVMCEKKERCKVPGCNGTPKAKCQKCDVHLCFTSTSNCFLRFHTE